MSQTLPGVTWFPAYCQGSLKKRKEEQVDQAEEGGARQGSPQTLCPEKSAHWTICRGRKSPTHFLVSSPSPLSSTPKSKLSTALPPEESCSVLEETATPDHAVKMLKDYRSPLKADQGEGTLGSLEDLFPPSLGNRGAQKKKGAAPGASLSLSPEQFSLTLWTPESSSIHHYTLSLEILRNRAGKMAQWVKLLAAKA